MVYKKIHRLDNQLHVLIIPKLFSKYYFIDIMTYFRSVWKKNSSEITAHGLYYVEHLLQPIKLFELTLKAPITTAADDKFWDFFPSFRQK